MPRVQDDLWSFTSRRLARVNIHSGQEGRQSCVYLPTGPPAYSTMGAYAQGERYLQAARICWSVASVFTIPLTSMVCSCAAVAFLQQRTRQQWKPTLRSEYGTGRQGLE
ncbi:hypothetical protein ACN42_g9854 [Penicillium freii]|uniref:Uncharacterized protein n=1 Tax=Penicillium freii TaxID=48697 RepID=A0A117NL97_PENFR|nr:hypothetical protein ACN42_g9854 [Penicillium freii]